MRFVLAIGLMFSIFNTSAKPIKPAAEWLPEYLKSQQVSIDVISSITFNQSDFSSTNSSLLVMPYSPASYGEELLINRSSIFIGKVNESKANNVYQLSCNIDGVGYEIKTTVKSSLPIVKRYIETLSETINKDTAICGLKALLWLDENNQQPSLTVFQKLSNVYYVLRALAPQNVENAYQLITNEKNKNELVFVEPSLANVSHVNALLNNKIPKDLISDYKKIYEIGLEEYKVGSKLRLNKRFKEKPEKLPKLIKKYYAEIDAKDTDTPVELEQKLLLHYVQRSLKSYEHTISLLFNFTTGEEVGGVNRLQDYLQQSILTWEKFGGAYKVVYDGVKIDQTIASLNERLENANERLENANERIASLKEREEKSLANIKAGIELLRRLGKEDKALKYEKLLKEHLSQ